MSAQTGPNTERMRRIALALPETHEEVTWGTDVNFRVPVKQVCVEAEPLP